MPLIKINRYHIGRWKTPLRRKKVLELQRQKKNKLILMAENAPECDACTMQTDSATAEPTSDEMAPKEETDIKTAEEALLPLPKKEDEVIKPKKPKYNLMECSIILEPLTEEVILKYTTAPFPPPKHSLRPLPAPEKGKFNRFKKQREKFVKKRGRKRKVSEDSLSDSLSPEQVEEENKKKKKVVYEQDVDWSPPEDCNLKPSRPCKKSNLRLNTRRKRLESGSSEESEGGQKVYDTRRRCSDPSKRAFLGESSSGDENFFDFLEEEVAFTKEESDPVGQLVTDIIDTVATMLDKPEDPPKCRWCDTEISDALAILCPICKDMGHAETIKPKKERKPKAPAAPSGKKKKGKGRMSIVSKLRKMLPKQEVQKFFSKLANCEGRTKKSPNVKPVNSKSLDDPILKPSEIASEAKQKAAKIPKKVSPKGNQKSLLLMNKGQNKMPIANPDNAKTAANQPTGVQHGTYLLPKVPSVVVANYATSDADKGDYFLSSLYYKNESTPSKAAVSSAVVTANSSATAIHTGMPKVNLVSTAPSALPGLTVREVIGNQLQVTPVSRTAPNPQMNSVPSAHFLSNSSISLVPIAPKPLNSTNQQVQITPVSNTLSMPSLSALVDSVPISSSVTAPALLQTQLNATLSSNPHLQISTFSTAMPSISSSVMQPQGSIVPASNIVGMNQNLQLVPVPQPSMSVITKTEPGVSPNPLGEILPEINPSLLVTPISNPSSLAPANNTTQNAPLMGTELPFSSGGSLAENILSSLPFSSDVSLMPTQTEELTNANLGGLFDNQVETSEKGDQFGAQSGDDLSTGQVTPMDTSIQSPEKSQAGDDSLENQSPSKDSGTKEFSPPDISPILIASLKESLTMRDKTLKELDAICIMCITDFDEDPKTSLLRFIESNRREQEELLLKQKEAPKEGEEAKAVEASSIKQKLQALERNASVYDIAWQYLKYHSSFQKYSDALLRTSRFMDVQIKKELIEQGEEEEETSSCQFANQNTTSNFSSNPSHQLSNQQSDTINNILTQMQTQVNSIPNASSYAMPGMVSPNVNIQHHGLSPVSASMGGDRETPSRGSGPRTPARPESALSQPEEILGLTPLQNGMPMQTANYSQQVNVQQVNIGQTQSVRTAGTLLPSGGQFQFQNSNPQTYQRMLVTMAQRQPTPSFQAQVRSSNGKVYNVMRVDAPRMIRPNYAVQANFVPTTAANHQNTFATVPAAQNQNSYAVQNNYGSTVVPVSLQNLTPGTTVVLQTGQPLQNQNRQPAENVDLSSLRCAVCNGMATLRCKQCSKVAYCNTACAKKYWHARHKMECMQLMNM